MYETSQQCNINVARIASHSEVTKHTEKPVEHSSCVVRAGRRFGKHLLPPCKTNVVIPTFGMTGRAVNIQGTLELCLPTEKLHLICADENQSENRENLLLLPCFLQPGHGLLVFFDDSAQTLPHVHSLLRPPTAKKRT